MLGMIAVSAIMPFVVSADVIDSMDVEVRIRPDGAAEVTETIRYDFGAEEHHGIYRDLPIVYADESGTRREITIDNIAVIDGKLSPYPFEQFRNGDVIRLKIGDPDVLISGKKTYEISYVAHDVIGFFDDHDELYWNATGNEWQYPIRESSARVYAPASTTKALCFAGPLGSTSTCSSIQSVSSDGSAMFFKTGHELHERQGLTVVVNFPKGYVTPPSPYAPYWKQARAMSPLGIPVVALIVLTYLWRKYGRDERGRGTIVPEYDAPPGVTPTIATEIMYERISSASLSAIIIDLAVRGYLKIHRDETTNFGVFTSVEYRFEKKKPADAHLRSDEKIVFDALFKDGDMVDSATLKKDSRLISALSEIQTYAGGRMVAEGYYRANPSTIKGIYIGAAFVCAFIGFGIAAGLESAWFFVASLITGILIGVFGLIMPAKTKKGALMKEQIRGLKEYLQIAEKNRLDFHNAPEKTTELFEKLLPFAMVLGVSAAWAKEFEGMYTKPPEWYSGASYAAFTPVAFANDMSAMSTAVSTLATPTSHGGGGGGGGFSGGGFGGGGGGSW